MSALTSLLVRDQIVPVRKIEEALQRHVVDGGAVETVLLEMGLVKEDVLSAYRAALFGLLPGTREEVMRAPREAVRRLPRELAGTLRLVPLSFDGRTLVVAAHEPPSQEALAKVEEAAAAPTAVRIVHEARLAAGLSHHYGIELDSRLRGLVDALRRQDAGVVPYVRPPAGGPIQAHAARATRSDAVQVEAPRRAPQAAVVTAGSVSPGALPEGVTPAIAKACRGPLVIKRAHAVLSDSETREDVLFVLLRFAAQFFDFAAVFSVRDKEARGRACRGDARSEGAIRGLSVPLLGGGLLARAVGDKRPLAGTLSHDSGEREATAPLGRPAGRPALALPVLVGTRVVLVLYLEREGEALGPEDATPLAELMPKIGEALRRIIVAQKALGTARATRAPHLEDEGREGDTTPSPARSTDPSDLFPSTRPRVLSSALLGVPREAPPPPLMDSSPPRPMRMPESSRPPPEHDARGGAYRLHAESGVISERAGSPLGAGRRHPGSARPHAPAIPSSRTSMQALAGQGAPLARPSDPEPSMVVDMGSQVASIVADLSRTPPDEEPREVHRLVEIGEAALPALMQAFPGPLWFDRHQPYSQRPRGRDVSAVARALVAFGELAAPYLATAVRDGRGDQGFYAVLVASDLPYGALVEPTARRMFDADPGIAQLAIEVLRGFAALPEFELVMTALSQLSEERERPLRQQFALRALAQLGDARAVGPLVRALDDPDPEVSAVAHDALVELTCHDLGAGSEAWQGWLSDHAEAHRVEWLIDALALPEEALHQRAAAELARLSQDDVGLAAGAGAEAREAAQRAYRDWWDRERSLLTSPAS